MFERVCDAARCGLCDMHLNTLTCVLLSGIALMLLPVTHVLITPSSAPTTNPLTLVSTLFPPHTLSHTQLIIRAIGVLEGIALVGDPEFALVDEAYPYIAKRLLTDPSPRLQVGCVAGCGGRERREGGRVGGG